MAQARGESTAASVDDHLSDADRDRARGYNSRYNPDFVKPLPHRRRWMAEVLLGWMVGFILTLVGLGTMMLICKPLLLLLVTL